MTTPQPQTTQLSFLAGAGWCALGTFMLGFLCLGSLLLWERDIQERCGAYNCRIDDRGWAAAHAVPAVALLMFATLTVVLLAGHLLSRRRG